MPEFRPHRRSDTGRPGPQTANDTSMHPGTPPGDPPRPNPGQANPGAGYTLLRGGQDVERPGYYFDEQSGEIRWWDKGRTIGAKDTQDTWLYLTDDHQAPLERLKDLIHERGHGGSLDYARLIAG